MAVVVIGIADDIIDVESLADPDVGIPAAVELQRRSSILDDVFHVGLVEHSLVGESHLDRLGAGLGGISEHIWVAELDIFLVYELGKGHILVDLDGLERLEHDSVREVRYRSGLGGGGDRGGLFSRRSRS